MAPRAMRAPATAVGVSPATATCRTSTSRPTLRSARSAVARLALSGVIAATSQQYPLKMASMGVEAGVEYAKTGVEPLTWSRELFSSRTSRALSRDEMSSRLTPGISALTV